MRRARLIPIPALAGSTTAKQIASLADLSQGIARLIDRSLPASSRIAARPRLEVPAELPAEFAAVVETPPAVETRHVLAAHAPDDAVDEIVAEIVPAPAAAWQPPSPPIDPPLERARASRTRTLERRAGTAERASQRAKFRSNTPSAAESWRSRSRRTTDFPSATDLSRRRQASPSWLASPSPRSHPRPERTRAPFGWSPARVPEKSDTEERFNIAYAPDEIEEAEVTILTADDLKEQQETAQRDGNLRRFRKALLGD